jgi:uncharacterized protein (TIGR02391 family)
LQELVSLIPDVEVLLALSPEELGAKILFLLRKRSHSENRGTIHVGNIVNEFENNRFEQRIRYPDQNITQVKEAFIEAWAWLEAQGLLVWSDTMNGPNGGRKLSRRAKSFEDERQFLAYATGKYLRPEMLHKEISKTVWLDFARGDFDMAILRAMKQVEIVVREKSNAKESDIGIKLMQFAFNEEDGPLTDLSEEFNERKSLRDLFVGAIGRFKNPQSHRSVGVEDAHIAIEIILFANHLLKILDGRPIEKTA